MLAVPAPGRAAHPDALWRLVHGVCAPMKRRLGLATPCLTVDTARGVAVVPNPRALTEVLLTPLVRITGIEDPRVLAADVPDYWAEAWRARRFVQARSERPLANDDLALAVNAVAGRSQDLLHIHVDCIRPSVKAALAAGDLPAQGWGALELFDGPWLVRRLGADAAPAPDPFHLLARTVPGAADDMGAWTLVVARRTGPNPGFILLARRTGAAFGGHGEALLDKRCAVARTPAPATSAR